MSGRIGTVIFFPDEYGGGFGTVWWRKCGFKGLDNQDIRFVCTTWLFLSYHLPLFIIIFPSIYQFIIHTSTLFFNYKPSTSPHNSFFNFIISLGVTTLIRYLGNLLLILINICVWKRVINMLSEDVNVIYEWWELNKTWSVWMDNSTYNNLKNSMFVVHLTIYIVS